MRIKVVNSGGNRSERCDALYYRYSVSRELCSIHELNDKTVDVKKLVLVRRFGNS